MTMFAAAQDPCGADPGTGVTSTRMAGMQVIKKLWAAPSCILPTHAVCVSSYAERE
jgi:hypothetical protein